MSRSHHDGHGRCGACGDAGAVRRAREAANDDTSAQLDDLEHYGSEYEDRRECDGLGCWLCDPDGHNTWRWMQHPAANNNAPLRVSIRDRLVS